MAENKIQHFVPQFLLRNFSVNQEQTHIALFNIRKEKFVSKTEIRTQAEKKYYYGDDGEVEKLLSMIEDRTAPIIKKMIEKNELPEVYSKGHYNLITFIMTMIGRTKYMGDTGLNPSDWTLGLEQISLLL